VLGAAGLPLESKSWLAAVTVVADRVAAGGDLSVIERLGWDGLAAAVRAELGATRWYSAIVRAVFEAATGPGHARVGVMRQRSGALERVAFALTDLAEIAEIAEIAEVDARMRAVLDQLDLTELVTTIPGVSRDRRRDDPGRGGRPDPALLGARLGQARRALPARELLGHLPGQDPISGRGRPELRPAAWRAVFTALQHNPVLAARHHHLVHRAQNPLTDTQARVAVAAGLLRERDRGAEAAPAVADLDLGQVEGVEDQFDLASDE